RAKGGVFRWKAETANGPLQRNRTYCCVLIAFHSRRAVLASGLSAREMSPGLDLSREPTSAHDQLSSSGMDCAGESRDQALHRQKRKRRQNLLLKDRGARTRP